MRLSSELVVDASLSRAPRERMLEDQQSIIPTRRNLAKQLMEKAPIGRDGYWMCLLYVNDWACANGLLESTSSSPLLRTVHHAW